MEHYSFAIYLLYEHILIFHLHRISHQKTFVCVAVFSKPHLENLSILQDILVSHETIDATTISAKLMSLDRRIENVQGDGNCLFRAVCDQLRNHPTMPVDITHTQLRQATVDYLRENQITLQVSRTVHIALFCILKCTLKLVNETRIHVCFMV